MALAFAGFALLPLWLWSSLTASPQAGVFPVVTHLLPADVFFSSASGFSSVLALRNHQSLEDPVGPSLQAVSAPSPAHAQPPMLLSVRLPAARLWQRELLLAGRRISAPDLPGSPVSALQGGTLPCDLGFQTDLRKVIDFQFYLAFNIYF